MTKKQISKNQIFQKVGEYYELYHKGKPKFVPGKTRIPYGGRAYDAKELRAAIDVALDFYLTLDGYAEKFEKVFCKFLKTKHAVLTNSGSSANLLAVSALKSPRLSTPLKDGDEVITLAATFPTTLNPIIQNNLTPVFVDVDSETYNMNAGEIEKALSAKTRAIMLPHVLGNPSDMDEIMRIAKKHNLLLIEDSCDALGSQYRGKPVGAFGDMGTFSFYAAHHITMGEGGAVVTRNSQLKSILTSYRDWGRSELGDDKGKRFQSQLGSVSYDKRYTFEHIGYNLKPTEFQAAIGWEQMRKIAQFKIARQKNFDRLHALFSTYADYFILPRATPHSSPSWFAFPLTVKPNKLFTRKDFVTWLEKHNIETRLLFAGNIIKHPAYRNMRYRAIGELLNTNRIFQSSFFIGVYPGITREMTDYIEEVVTRFFDRKKRVTSNEQ